ncbi:hypothetical protein M413DRAFT_22429 [Hebeloma cylindrosporum]|uniref:Cytochrome P450 n=1 Tax=Hebeloma cylindrosporum TaxID=76867 RepID=A0A0C3CGE4_HEBCY|nr:hypothetical protein M413DRAFT_22429 [Hebeloma cylindrosporum h7]
MDAEDAHSSAIFIFLGAAILLTLVSWTERREPNLKHIPTFGQPGYILSYFDAFTFTISGLSKLQRGCDKYRPRIFKVATLSRWLVIVTGPQHVEELRKATEEELSVVEPTTGHFYAAIPKYTNQSIRYMTQHVENLIPDLSDELIHVLHYAIPFTPAGESAAWKGLDAVEFVTLITTSTINRMTVGVLFTREMDYAFRSAALARKVFVDTPSIISSLLPDIFKSFFRALSPVQARRRIMKTMLVRYIKAKKNIHDRGDSHEPNGETMLSWMLTNEQFKTMSNEEIASSILDFSVTSFQRISIVRPPRTHSPIATSLNIFSKDFANALYYLAASPKHAVPMRREIEGVIKREWWSKDAINRMRKVDSFLKESMRMGNASSLSVIRKTLKPFTFLDGTCLPTGTVLAVATPPQHLDANLQSSPDEFDGFRFSRLHEQEHGSERMLGGGGGMRYQLVATSPDFLAWGYGRHACPARFMAAMVLKTIFIHLVLKYDVRFEDGVRPEDRPAGLRDLPNPNVKILIRPRPL